MNIIKTLKNNIRKYIRKYIPFALAILALPFLTVNSFAVEVSPDAKNEWFLLPFNYFDDYDVAGSFDDVSGSYNGTGSGGNDNYLNFTVNSDSSGVFPQFFANRTYLIYTTVSLESSSIFSVNRGLIRSTWGVAGDGLSLTDFVTNSSRYVQGTTTVSSIFTVTPTSDISISTASQVVFVLDSSVSHSGRVAWAFYALDITNSTESEVNSIVSAINNQTNQLGSQLGDIDGSIQQGNDLIENGNSGSQSAVSDFNEVFDDFNSELDTWEQFDDAIIGEFNLANDNYMTELNNFSLSGSLLNAGTWLSTSMQTVYDNSSDYKMLWLVPMLFGIPILLFIIRKNGDDE